MSTTDTIYATSTAPARSGVAVLRISGSQSLACLKQLARIEHVKIRHAHYASFFDPKTEELIDKGLAIFFAAPHSFTGEDVVELQVHGSLAVLSQIGEALSQMPSLRAAEAGEFTRRAFLNGKMDLLEAEGLMDLIDSETREQKSQALRQMQGELSGFFEALRTNIIRCLAHLEAYIDFPDEEIPESVLAELDGQINAVAQMIRTALDDGRRGQRVRDGISIAILGAPNVGKSSLLNRIAQRDVAIVSHRAGTTRDAIEVHLDIAGYPVILVDTAGIRDSDDEIEREGIRRAKARAEQADITLVLFDASSWPNPDAMSLSLLSAQSIAVVNKSDLLGSKKNQTHPQIAHPVFIAAQDGQGVDRLMELLRERIIQEFSAQNGSFITRERHRAMLQSSLTHLQKSLQPLPLELRCEELRLSAQYVGKITGKIQVDDVLDVIFSSFCIGK